MLFLAAEAVLFTALLLLIESPPDVLARFVRLGARWLGRSAECPLCRTPMTPQAVRCLHAYP